MQLSQLICVCVLILWLTGALKGICLRLGSSAWQLAFSAICLLFLQCFDVSVTPELKLNAAVLLLPVALLVVAAGERGSGGAVLRFVFFGALLGVLDAGLGLSSSLLMGAVCGFIGTLLSQNEDAELGFSLFAAATLPLCSRILTCGIELLYTGYTSCDLATGYVLDAQLFGCVFVCLFAYAFKLRREVIKD